ncbi:RNAse P Rpr2/Rpp21/SNM1 subunit domain-containing protein [Hysterangium stoloniferum]|nr:RNAse P Rpr2/Rpp21/SNM1 subunit domain-containing protein [Hysterangium stoloniferum]
MVKNLKGKDDAPHPSGVPNREIFQRLNFLYQASAYLHGIHVSTTAMGQQVDGAINASRKDQGKRKRVATLGDLGSSYIHCMRVIGRKSVVRMDPNVKRTLCTRCDTVLLPGTTASVRLKGSSRVGKKMVYTCLSCNTSRAIPAPNTPQPISDIVATQLTAGPLPSPLETPGALSGISTPQPSNRRKKRKEKLAHSLPLFARSDAGHVVFRGNEIIQAME